MIYVAYRKNNSEKECALYRKRDWQGAGGEKIRRDEGTLCTIPVIFLQV